MKKLNLLGQKYGRLTVIDYADNIYYGKRLKSAWKCKCECGNELVVTTDHLRNGHTKSCGCYAKDIFWKWMNKRVYIKHERESDTRLYEIWSHMKSRCNINLKHSRRYKDYAGRGIKVCDEWKNNYISFKKWACENGYHDNLTIDRIDVNGNYEPNNCRWVTLKEQCYNKRNNLYFFGKVLKEWCQIYNMNYVRVYKRIFYWNWTFFEALLIPINSKSELIKINQDNRLMTHGKRNDIEPAIAEYLSGKSLNYSAKTNHVRSDRLKNELIKRNLYRIKNGESI